jgi:hypothetical protein
MKKLFIVLLILMTLTACKTKEILIPVERVKIEYKDRLRIDSVYNRDTMYLFTENDTVYLQSIKWRERFRIDTVNLVKVDSIPYKVEVIKEVNKLTKWQKTRLDALNIIVILILIYALIKIKL